MIAGGDTDADFENELGRLTDQNGRKSAAAGLPTSALLRQCTVTISSDRSTSISLKNSLASTTRL